MCQTPAHLSHVLEHLHQSLLVLGLRAAEEHVSRGEEVLLLVFRLLEEVRANPGPLRYVLERGQGRSNRCWCYIVIGRARIVGDTVASEFHGFAVYLKLLHDHPDILLYFYRRTNSKKKKHLLV